MSALLGRLREWKHEGMIVRVVAFSTSQASESAEQGEHRIASALAEAADEIPSALVIALTGNVHASKRACPG
jgi:hypothetical protein